MARRRLTAKTWLLMWTVCFVATFTVVNIIYTNELDINTDNDPGRPLIKKSHPSDPSDSSDTNIGVELEEADNRVMTDGDNGADTPIKQAIVDLSLHVQQLQGEIAQTYVYSHGTRGLKLWPDQTTADRIVDQLRYRNRRPGPEKAQRTASPNSNSTDGLKVIYLAANFMPLKLGRQQLLDDKCEVDTCFLTRDSTMAYKADTLVFKSVPKDDAVGRKPVNQTWLLYQLESPYHSGTIASNLMNWTATYRRDSTLQTPYEKFAHFANYTGLPAAPRRDYALGKTKMAAWFVTNCRDKNGRLKYAHELQKHVQVDIYGSCGTLKCARKDSAKCFDMLNKDYKFYLAFENSNCQDYITEKLYWNALFNDIVPIVMGARPEDYRVMAPPHSFIHVDDFKSPKALAEYLQMLDRNSTAYNEYFLWKGTGDFINTKFWCRLCAMMHAREADGKVAWYDDLRTWWKGPGVCIQPSPIGWASWRDANVTVPINNTLTMTKGKVP